LSVILIHTVTSSLWTI